MVGKARKKRGKSSLESVKNKKKKQLSKQRGCTSKRLRDDESYVSDDCQDDDDLSLDHGLGLGPQSDLLLDELARVEGKSVLDKHEARNVVLDSSPGPSSRKKRKRSKESEEEQNSRLSDGKESNEILGHGRLVSECSNRHYNHVIESLLSHTTNTMNGWFETPIQEDPIAEQSRIDRVKQERKSLGLRVSSMKNKADAQGNYSTDPLREILPFEPELCPPPLPLDVFEKVCNNSEENLGGCSVSQDSPNALETIILPDLYKHFFIKEGKKKKNAITRPTPIQAQAWPILSLGRCNLLGIAPTGSGKTLAFGLPMTQICINAIKEHDIFKRSSSSYKKKKAHLKSLKSSYKVEQGPICLILSPTRELAHQSGKVLKSVSQSSANALLEKERQKHITNFTREQFAGKRPTLNVMSIYGGCGSEDRREQAKSFTPGEPMIHILSATPGRLLDLIGSAPKKDSDSRGWKTSNKAGKGGNSGILGLGNVAFLVIDEADKMLQMGFREQVCAIVEHLRNDRITCLFSATFPQRLAEAADEWLGEARPTVLVRASMLSFGEESLAEAKGKLQDAQSSPRNECSSPESEHLKNVSSLSLIVGKAVVSDKKIDSGNPEKQKESIAIKKGHEDANIDGELDSISNYEKHSSPEKEVGKDRLSEVSSIPGHIAQVLNVCAAHKKPKKLIGILQKLRQAEKEQGRSRHQGLLVVFFSKIKTLKYIAGLLRQQDVKCRELHGQMRQGDRERTLNDFKAGKISTLLATDIAGRGIHVNNVEYVVNYDFPLSIEQYVHRCGRAARNYDPKKVKDLSKPAACVYSFFTRDFAPMAPDMLRLLRASNAWIDPNLVKLVNEGGGSKRDKSKSASLDTKPSRKKKCEEADAATSVETSEKELLGDSRRGNSYSDEKSNEEEEADELEHSDDEFSHLNTTQIVLKRAEHVSDAEDSSDEDDD